MIVFDSMWIDDQHNFVLRLASIHQYSLVHSLAAVEKEG